MKESENIPLLAILLVGIFVVLLVMGGEYVKAWIWASAWGR